MRAGLIAGQGNELDLDSHVETADEVGQEDEASLEDSDKERSLAPIVPSDLSGNPRDGLSYLLWGDELGQSVPARGYRAICCHRAYYRRCTARGLGFVNA